MVFCIWFLLFNIMFLQFICIAVYIGSTVLFNCRVVFHVWIYHSFSFTLGMFPNLGWYCKYFYFHMSYYSYSCISFTGQVNSFCYIPNIKIGGSWGRCIFNIIRITKHIYKMGLLLCIPHQQYFSHSNEYVVLSNCGFNLHFYND